MYIMFQLNRFLMVYILEKQYIINFKVILNTEICKIEINKEFC